MKQTFSFNAKRYMTTMVLAIVSFFSVWATDNFNDVVGSVVPVTFTNDATHPWSVEGNMAIIRGTNQSNYYAASWLTMAFSTNSTTQLSFEWAFYNYGYHEDLQVFVDGKYHASKSNSTYSKKIIILEPGEHIIAFRDSVGYYNYTGNWSGVKNIVIEEYETLESTVLTDNSAPLTFETGGEYPWTTEDGYIQNSNYGVSNSSSRFSSTFTVDKLSRFSFDYRVGYYNGTELTTDQNYSHRFRFYVNGKQRKDVSSAISYEKTSIVLDPGTYTMEWVDTIMGNSSPFISQIRNMELSPEWVSVELASAGSLGVEVLYLVDVLTDVGMLKVKGPLNSTDWTNIKQMKNLTCLDLSEAYFDAIPDRAFEGLNSLSRVMLPQGVKTIGQFAFYNTQVDKITLPESLTSIRNAAFANCVWLKQIEIPHSVTSIGYCAFQGCTTLHTLSFSDGMTEILDNVCRGCNSLTNVYLPKNLQSIGYYSFAETTNLRKIQFPSSLNYIRNGAFYKCGLDSVALPVKLQYLESGTFSYCNNLKYVELPSLLLNSNNNYHYYYLDGNNVYQYSWSNTFYTGCRNNFSYCPMIEKVVCMSATPPVIYEDPFSNGRNKNEITLVVPSFAVVNYKLDTYWYQFGSIVEGDDIDYWAISSVLSLTNNRRMNGKPDIDLCEGGQLTVGGNAPMEIGQFNLFNSEQNPCRLLNLCENMTADSINSYFSVNAGTWYFFTPLHDVDLSKVNVSNEASYVFRYYDGSSRASVGAGSSWRNVDSNKLTAGQGYIFHCNANAVITMPANATAHGQVFRTTDFSKPLATYESTTSANKNWNYVGNPYPCYYDIYYMDFTAPITVWTGSTYKAYSIADDDYALRPMQSFFVQKPDAVDNIIFRKEGRQLTSEIAHGASARSFRAPSQANRYFFNLQLASEEMIDETRVVVNEKASLDYEIEHDAAKFMSFDSAVPQLFTVDDAGNSYAINERPFGDGKVKLAYYAGKNGFYTISATRTDGTIYLYDAETNETVDLTEQEYTFHSDVTVGNNDTRFMLTLSVSGETTGINVIEGTKNTTDNSMYDLQGRKVQFSTKKGIYIHNGQKVVR